MNKVLLSLVLLLSLSSSLVFADEYSVYSGSAGQYASPFVMYLKNNNGKYEGRYIYTRHQSMRYEGRYIYTRHQRWIDISGQKNSKGYIELEESYQGKVTGRILVKQTGLELNGQGFWGGSAEGQVFKALLRAKVDDIKKNPRDGHYIREHSKRFFDKGEWKVYDTQDALSVHHFTDKGFSFHLKEVGDNGHQGTLSGSVTYKGETAIFDTTYGCRVTFRFDEKRKSVMYEATEPTPEAYKRGACNDFGGSRVGLEDKEFFKVDPRTLIEKAQDLAREWMRNH